MKTFDSWRQVLACLLLVGAAACKVEFPDAPYTCETNADCGGDSFVCAELPNGGPRYCCKPESAEVCNRLDDDCDGEVDELDTPCYSGPEGTRGVGTCRDGRSVCANDLTIACVDQVKPTAERCNQLDDDCDGQVDEDFNLQTDVFNCGACGTVCAAQQNCVEGHCQKRAELDCGNGFDDNQDGQADCMDRDDCDNQACGAGCVCENGRRTESDCGDGSDGDDDGNTDCADRDDCDNQACGAGCVCVAGRKVETLCTVGSGDEDGDGRADCDDTDCAQQACGAGLTCHGAQCLEGACDNGVDDDGNGSTDCQDTGCAGLSCGLGCVCKNLARSEENCGDGLDNDGDGDTDCADRQDCDYAALATSGTTVTVMCVQGSRAEVACSGGVDDDGNGRTDCQSGNADPNCVSGECGAGCALQNCARREMACTDGRDNDGDGTEDCGDSDCNNQSCGNGCVCSGGTRKETLCNDLIDNDGNNGVDCADQTDCPRGTACMRLVNGVQTPGTCQNNRTCG
ncbi:hypothetical protein LY474_35600 [Myxococcus stipitatus]|uniref:MopE-related protein n=1 Tax=Myxococcus stipitatus TaxID=83455 RepID=UPI001F20838C|nr:MopE-related protein [Myxococcus stipitatus]MCE9673146.1 hypothetical protein [Myxococcus stipitatus]